ncbi:MAG: DnaD domain protein [Clostridia bacterium]|nr:DnaD domain protein [Clostridia bacterium]
MANPQPTDAHGIITHEIQENILIRDFSKQQLKIIYLIIRLSWGCGNKAWQYENYKDFEVVGLFKSDVSKQLTFLKNNKVIEWIEKYNLLIFNKDYEQWLIPLKSDSKTIKNLVHKCLKNTNEVSNLLTVLEKNTNEVSKKSEQFVTDNPTDITVSGVPKESIKESIIVSSSCSPYSYYEQNISPLVMKSRETITSWLEMDKMPSELICRAIDIAVRKNKRELGYIDGIIRKWTQQGIFTLAQADAKQMEWDRIKSNIKPLKPHKPELTEEEEAAELMERLRKRAK